MGASARPVAGVFRERASVVLQKRLVFFEDLLALAALGLHVGDVGLDGLLVFVADLVAKLGEVLLERRDAFVAT